MSNQPTVHDLAWTEEMLERFWSYYAGKPHTYYAEVFGDAIVAALARWLKPGAVCIDYGCGSGGLIRALLDAGYRTGGMDLSQTSVAAVQQRFAGRSDFIGAWTAQDSASQLPPADVLFSLETIEHVTEPLLAGYFAEVKKRLAPSGAAIFSTPNNEDIENAKVFCPESGAVFHPMQHVRSFDVVTLPHFLRAHGFEIEKVWVTDFGATLRHPRRWIAARGKRLFGFGAPPPHLVAVARRGS